jgi:hypothetical protein
MQAIEEHFKFADRYELFTGHRSGRNLYLYQKLGYHEYKQEMCMSDTSDTSDSDKE